jgi:tetratricopeptide (TPR) repeat protein
MKASRYIGLLAGICVLLWPAFPRLEGGETTNALLGKATDLYSELRFEEAIKVLDRAIKNPGNTREQLVRAHLLRGICLGSVGRYKQAKHAFACVLALDPSARLDRDLAPRVREPFRRLLSGKRPRLDVAVLPPARAVSGNPIRFTAAVKEDTLGLSRAVRIWIRPDRASRYSSVRAVLRGEVEVQIAVPATLWEGNGPGESVAWYAVILGENQSTLKRFGDEIHPLSIGVADREVAAAGSEETHWYQRWWVWAIVGSVVAGGAAAAFLYLSPQDSAAHHDITVVVD